MVTHLKWGGDRNTLVMLCRAIVRSKLDYSYIVYGTASNDINFWQLDSIQNSGLRLASGACCTSPISNMYTEVNETPLEERRWKLSIWNLVPVMTIQYITPCMNLTEPLDICMSPPTNVLSPDKKPKLNSMTFVKHKDHMMKFTLMAQKWMIEWGQQLSSTAITRMVRQPAANCPKDYQTTAPSL